MSSNACVTSSATRCCSMLTRFAGTSRICSMAACRTSTWHLQRRQLRLRDWRNASKRSAPARRTTAMCSTGASRAATSLATTATRPKTSTPCSWSWRKAPTWKSSCRSITARIWPSRPVCVLKELAARDDRLGAGEVREVVPRKRRVPSGDEDRSRAPRGPDHACERELAREGY
jgi:hypothetical protein